MSFITDLIAPVARTGITWMSRRSLPQTEGALNLPGLQSPVDIHRDRWGIPHIYAANRHDLFFAQGFVHAQDRLWQMEVNRRTAYGRLSEIFGPIALDTDRTVRTFGFARLGQADWDNAGDEVRTALNAYAEGVNTFLNHPGTRLPVEFTLLRHKPEPWQALDSAAFARVMVWELSHAWYGEIVRARLIEAVGAEHAAELELHYPAANPISLPQGIEFNRLDPDGRLEKTPGPFLERGKGSNAWVVAGGKSVTGHPILCNDMHLALSLPSIWYEVHLKAPDIHVTGVSLPGVPMVLVGHNERISWGITLAFTDCEDLFVEKVDPQAPQRYQYEGEWLDAQVIPEAIRVKGQAEPTVEQVRITRHGPIIAEVDGHPEQRLAVNSMSLRPCKALHGWLKMDEAQGWDEFVDAMRLIEAPQLNIAYADVDGNIGYWVTGRVPVRAKGTGEVPAPGWTGQYEWIGEVPFEEMPHALNPQQGFVVTCNNKIVPDDYPNFLGNAWMNGYRAQQIEDVIKSKERLSFEDFRGLHMDFTSIPGKEFVARLEGLESADPDVQLALKHLRAWDCQLGVDSVGGSFYEVARYTMVRSLLEPHLGTDLAMRMMGLGFHPLLLFASEIFGHDTVMLLRMLDNPESWWIQQAGGREAVLTRSLQQAVEWLRAELGSDVNGWQWGKLHKITFSHTLAMQKPLDKVFNRGPVPIGGDTDTPCQTATLPDAPYGNNAWSPSVRFIMDMGDLSRSIAVFPPGQSGQLGSPHYDDLIEPWLKGDYHPMLWTEAQVEQGKKHTLRLKPGVG